jgi:hypothetical protein
MSGRQHRRLPEQAAASAATARICVKGIDRVVLGGDEEYVVRRAIDNKPER